MNIHEIVKKLIGEIDPIGETQTDSVRFENLEAMTKLVDVLVTDIDNVVYDHRNSHEFSVKKAADFASKFLTKTLGIVE